MDIEADLGICLPDWSQDKFHCRLIFRSLQSHFDNYYIQILFRCTWENLHWGGFFLQI